MTILGSDGLSLSVGDGGSPETFNVLRGATVTKFDLSQKIVDSDSVLNTAWRVGAATDGRSASIACEGMMTDEAAPQHLRSLAINGAAGNFKLELGSTQTLSVNAYVTSYQEVIQAGAVKRFSCQLDSNGAIAIG